MEEQMKYGEWLTEWLNNYVRISAKYRTIERYSEIICNHLIPSVGGLEMQELTPKILQKYISELLYYQDSIKKQGNMNMIC